ncbi:hypothetical protein GCM10023178_01680 [Actinomadura luteofluorescens]
METTPFVTFGGALAAEPDVPPQPAARAALTETLATTARCPIRILMVVLR